MRVLYFATEFPPLVGGGATCASSLVSALSESGTEVLILTSGDKDEEVMNSNLQIIRSRALGDLYRGHGDIFQGVNLLIKLMKEWGPDVLHTQHSLETLIGLIANKSFGKPHFCTLTKTPQQQKEGIALNGKWAFSEFISSATELKHIVHSNFFSEGLKTFGVNPKNIDVIYPSVDIKRFSKSNSKDTSGLRKKLGLDEDDVLILIPCLPRARKGLEFVASTINRLKTQNGFKFLITGLNNGNLGDFPEFIPLVDSGLVVVKDKITDQEMPILYSLASMTVLVSEVEGLGISLVEAMACGCPVIGSDVNGINEVIKKDRNGLLVNYGDVDSLSESIKTLLSDSHKRNDLVASGLKSVADQFDSIRQASLHNELYDEAVKSKVQSSGGVLFRRGDSGIEVFLAKHSVYGLVLPKGRKESKETWAEAAVREIKEESGYQVARPKYNLGKLAYEFEKEGKKISKEAYFYGFEIDENTERRALNLDIGEKVSEGEWLPIEEAIKSAAHTTEAEFISKLKDFL